MNILISQYFTQECSGPPAAMYNFVTADVSNVTQPIDESWPIGYSMLTSTTVPLLYCGTILCSFLPENGIACFNALHSMFSPYESLSVTSIKEKDSKKSIPPISEDAKYCHLTATDSHGLLGMNEAYLLASGTCIDGIYQCFPNGTLFVYSGGDCYGEREAAKLEQTILEINSTTIGLVSGKMMVISKDTSNLVYMWQAFLPEEYLVPYFKIATEIIALICIIAAALLMLYGAFSTATELYLNPKKRKLFGINQLFCYILKFNEDILSLFFWSTVFYNDSYYIFWEITSIHFALGSLAQVLLSTQIFVFEINQFLPWQQFVTLVTIVSVHVGLSGARYLAFFGGNPYFQAESDFYYSWEPITVYWDLLAAFYLNVLPVLIIYKFLKLKYVKLTFKERIKKVYEIDRWLGIALLLQLFLQLFVALTRWLCYTIAYGSDRILLSMIGYWSLSTSIGAYLVVRIAIGLRKVGSHEPSKGLSATRIETGASSKVSNAE